MSSLSDNLRHGRKSRPGKERENLPKRRRIQDEVLDKPRRDQEHHRESSIIDVASSDTANTGLLKRDEWMQPIGTANSSTTQNSDTFDYFASMGAERKRRRKEDKPNPEKLVISSKELNHQLVEGKTLDEYVPSVSKPGTPGGPGFQWRMMKLRRVFETAKEEGRNVEEVALERYDSLQAFYDAQEERRLLDEQKGSQSKRTARAGSSSGQLDDDPTNSRPGPSSKLLYNHTDLAMSRSASRSPFRRPGSSVSSSPSPGRVFHLDNTSGSPGNIEKERRHPLSQSHSHLPPVSLPTSSRRRQLSPSSLNKLQAKALKAKLMGLPNADALNEDYERERASVEGSPGASITKVEVLPTTDFRGRLYDVGSSVGKERERSPKVTQNREGDQTLGNILEMLVQEKVGSSSHGEMDTELARQIMTDGKFENDIEYMDDNAEKLGRKKLKSDAMKRQFAINDFKRTQKALSNCPFCHGDDDTPPRAAIIAMATRCYLACPIFQDLVHGHCLIIPIAHHLSMLEGDNDLWDEVKNFMKCLMQMFAEKDQGVVFYETVISIRSQHHTFIECVPVPWEQFEELPAYFKESILASDTEWTQHRKLIDFSSRPGGFRRSMVPNLPYFMVQFDYRGEKGFGHVIEGSSQAAGEEDNVADEETKGGVEFPRFFAGEIIGNVLDIAPQRWRRPRRIDTSHNRERVVKFRSEFDKYDWTKMLEDQ